MTISMHCLLKIVFALTGKPTVLPAGKRRQRRPCDCNSFRFGIDYRRSKFNPNLLHDKKGAHWMQLSDSFWAMLEVVRGVDSLKGHILALKASFEQ
jgi:hypothetical protein